MSFIVQDVYEPDCKLDNPARKERDEIMILAYCVTEWQYYFLVVTYWGLEWVVIPRTSELES